MTLPHRRLILLGLIVLSGLAGAAGGLTEDSVRVYEAAQ